MKEIQLLVNLLNILQVIVYKLVKLWNTSCLNEKSWNLKISLQERQKLKISIII